MFRRLEVGESGSGEFDSGEEYVGKTALLEALILHAGGYNVTLPVQIHQHRGFEGPKTGEEKWEPNPWESMFRDFNIDETIWLSGDHTSVGKWSVGLSLVTPPSELGPVPSSLGPRATDTERTTKVLELAYIKDGKTDKYYGFLAPTVVWGKPTPPAAPFPGHFQSARGVNSFEDIAERFAKLQVENKANIILDFLRLIEPRLKELTLIYMGGKPILHGGLATGRLLPLPLMGDGMGRLADVSMIICNAQNGICLIDEIENGLHHSIMKTIWKAIGEAARQFNCQIFATTHSRECIIAAHEAFSENETYDFRLHRLDRVNGTIKAVTYDQETLEAAIETDMEVR